MRGCCAVFNQTESFSPECADFHNHEDKKIQDESKESEDSQLSSDTSPFFLRERLGKLRDGTPDLMVFTTEEQPVLDDALYERTGTYWGPGNISCVMVLL
jgi:hypothetical protein